MNTCEKCGCYIPDNWTECPACRSGKEKRIIHQPIPVPKMPITSTCTWATSENQIFRVDVLYDYERVKTSEFFNNYEDALFYAKQVYLKSEVFAVQIITGGRIIFSVNENNA